VLFLVFLFLSLNCFNFTSPLIRDWNDGERSGFRMPGVNFGVDLGIRKLRGSTLHEEESN
jgi:hypothetical protein